MKSRNRSEDLTLVMIRFLTRDGSRSHARRLLTEAMETVLRVLPEKKPQDILTAAIYNAAPVVEIVPNDPAATPLPVPAKNRIIKGIRAILKEARGRSGRITVNSLAAALLAAHGGELPSPDRPKAAERLSVRSVYRSS